MFRKLKDEINRVNIQSCKDLYIYAKNGTGSITLKKQANFKYTPDTAPPAPESSIPFTQEETKVENPEKDVEMSEMKESLDEIDEEQRLFDQEYGFSRIVEMMIDSKLPLVGHNCMYDICFFYRQFIDELPATFDEFKEVWTKFFPFTYDTKVIS